MRFRGFDRSARATVVLGAVACCPRIGLANAYETRIYSTARVEAAPRIDGKLEDAVWDQVEWETDFIQLEPTEGVPPSQQTAFKIVYDDNALYIACRAWDSEPDRIARELARRDEFPGDWIAIDIDSHHDQRTAFSF